MSAFNTRLMNYYKLITFHLHLHLQCRKCYTNFAANSRHAQHSTIRRLVQSGALQRHVKANSCRHASNGNSPLNLIVPQIRRQYSLQSLQRQS